MIVVFTDFLHNQLTAKKKFPIISEKNSPAIMDINMLILQQDPFINMTNPVAHREKESKPSLSAEILSWACGSSYCHWPSFLP